MSPTCFQSLSLNTSLLENLKSLQYKEMTEIQAQSLPPMIAGQDVIAQAKTGSGKTAAFGLAMLNKLQVKRFRVQSLVLCPTRELADQVAKEIRRLGRGIHNIKVLTLCGGAPFGPQIGSLEHGAHIVVGTPGRIEEHLRKGTLRLDDVTTFVLDEADRMLDMGFQPSLDAIVDYLPAKRQTLLFSATYPEQIQLIAKRIMHEPIRVTVETAHDDSSIEQHFYALEDGRSRTEALQLLLLTYRPNSAVVFCNTKRETQEVADELARMGFAAVALNGDMEQKMRDQTLVRFANNSASILVATDVAARGLDIDDLDAVFNYQLSREIDVHTHRIGRTGRAGSKGHAFTLYTSKERYKVEMLEKQLSCVVEPSPLPNVSVLNEPAYKPSMSTLQIDGGKKQKVRPGDIVGALTGEGGITGKQVGKIHVFDNTAYVAVERSEVKTALHKIERGKLKGRSFRVRHIRG
ncbi:ATP-dependent RNA helicase DbpA [gamma proteobacterium IMCC1989]|nr:ATP-dependent RNA helicase DbpA [gamma proteobacterium IMCC1989]